MATDLRANDTIQVRVPQGGGSVRDVPLSELNEYISTEEAAGITALETYVCAYSSPAGGEGSDIATDLATIWEDVYPKSEPDGTSISERMDALDDTETGVVPVLMERADAVDQQLFETQGVADKLAAIELRKDESFEILANKNIVDPQINETPVRAYFDIPLAAPAQKKIRISAITPGVAANSYNWGVVAVASADPSNMEILWSASNLVVRVLKDDDERITTTAYEVARLAAVTPDFVSNFIISFDDGTLITEYGDGAGVINAANDGKFANGAGADHVLTSTGTQIDAAVNMYLSNKYDATAAPGATNDIDEGYVVGSKWFNTVSKEWYICTANTQDNATWANTTLEAGDLGRAAIADIVNDLTTGGASNALSAEQGKDLKTTLNTEAGYIDALQAVAPEYVATFSTATAASAVLTSDTTAVTNGSEVTVNDVTYTFVTALTTDPATVPNEVLIGANSDESLTNLKLAINGEATEGTNYSTDTDQPTDVTATVDTDANTVTVTATTKGVGGNAHPKASDDAHLVWDATDPADKFSGGVDGQVGATGKIVFTDDAVYCCTDGTKCVATDSSGWKSAAFG